MTIKEIRKTLNMTQQQFAEEFGMSKRTVGSWEDGTRNAPEWVINLIERVIKAEKMEGNQ